MTDWPDGPREWSPRYRHAEEEIRKLRAAIPTEMIIDRSVFVSVMQIALANMVRPVRLEMIVKIRDQECLVLLYADGEVKIATEIRLLLQGLLPGYQHLAGRWPWPGGFGPPNPRDPLGRYS